MNTFAVALLCFVATASAGHLGYGGYPNVGYYAPNPEAHIPSGSVSVSHDGATVAGPAGSVRTDNGLHGHGAATVVDGPAGKIATQGGHTVVTGPGNEHDGGYDGGYNGGYNGGYVAAAPVAYAAPAVAYAAPVAYAAAPVHAVPGVGAWGPAAGLIGHGGYGGYGGYGYGHGGYGHGW